MVGSMALVARADHSPPNRMTSRKMPNLAGCRTAIRNTAWTTASTAGQPVRPVPAAISV